MIDKKIECVYTFSLNNVSFQLIVVDDNISMTQFIQNYFDIDICKNTFWYNSEKQPNIKLYNIYKLIHKKLQSK